MGEAQQRAKVLIVDDERGPRESLRMILSPQHQVLQASSGSDALAILRREPVEVVTLDLNMPGMDGGEVMRTVRAEWPETEIIVITGCGSIESATEGIRAGICDYLQKPFDVVQVTAAVLRALARQRARVRLSRFLEELGGVVGHDRDAGAILHDLQTSQKLRDRLGGLLSENNGGATAEPPRTVEFLEVLAETIETKDRFMRGHARRVAYYASLLGERLSLSVEALERVRIAAFLHDLGKVGVPTDLLLRAGALDASERALVERHPEIGARLLKPLDIPESISAAILHHHEWYDGNGYPSGLSGEEIPLEARIISVVDAFDAMSCDRPYRQALAREVAVSELRRFSGTQFDPHLAKEFLVLLDSGACDVDVALIADAVANTQTAPAAQALAG